MSRLRSIPLVVWALAWCAVLVVQSVRMDAISDDAFITLRYAQNLLHSEGLVYNPGEPVEGYTSLLWTLAVATLGASGVDLLVASRGLALVCAVALIPVALIVFRTTRNAAYLIPPVIALAAPIQCAARTGLETSGYALLLLASLGLASHAEDRLLAVVLVPLVLVRPEGAVYGLLIGFAVLALRRRALPAVAAFTTFAIHLAWRWHTYGDLVANTARAKVEPGLAQIHAGADYVLSFVAKCGGLPVGLLFLLVVVPAVWWRGPSRWVFAGFVAVLATTVLEGGDVLFLYRFLVPAIVLWAILWARGADLARDRWGVPGAALSWVLTIPILWGLSRLPPEDRQVQKMEAQRDGEVPAWSLVGQTMASWGPGSVALVPIGAVGYYSGLVVRDMMGLTDRHIARVAPDGSSKWGHDRHDGPYILSLRPTFILTGNVRVTPERLDFAADPATFLSAGGADRRREGDLYVDDLFVQYAPADVQLGDGRWLSFLVRRDRAR